EMIDDDAAYRVRFCKPQVDGDAAAPVVARIACAPIGDASAVEAKMKAELLASAGVGARRTGNAYAFILVVVGPQRAVAAADRAVAGGGRLRHAVEGPAHGAAVAGAFDHSDPHQRKAVIPAAAASSWRRPSVSRPSARTRYVSPCLRT